LALGRPLDEEFDGSGKEGELDFMRLVRESVEEIIE
jgi:hypothetical protein